MRVDEGRMVSHVEVSKIEDLIPQSPEDVKEILASVSKEILASVSEELRKKSTRWIEWVDPFGPNSEPVYCRVSEQTAIATMKVSAQKKGYEYKTDQEALLDFMTIHYAMSVETRTMFSPKEVIDLLEAWTSLDVEPEDDEERVVQRTCRRLKATVEELARQKEVG